MVLSRTAEDPPGAEPSATKAVTGDTLATDGCSVVIFVIIGSV